MKRSQGKQGSSPRGTRGCPSLRAGSYARAGVWGGEGGGWFSSFVMAYVLEQILLGLVEGKQDCSLKGEPRPGAYIRASCLLQLRACWKRQRQVNGRFYLLFSRANLSLTHGALYARATPFVSRRTRARVNLQTLSYINSLTMITLRLPVPMYQRRLPIELMMLEIHALSRQMPLAYRPHHVSSTLEPWELLFQEKTLDCQVYCVPNFHSTHHEIQAFLSGVLQTRTEP
jgi:hypothetical protein